MSEHDDHGHVPGHSHAPASFGRAFAVGIALNVAFVAIEAGWMVTELGRQPWIIYEVMRTKDALTEMPGLGGPFAAIAAVYLMLAVIVVVLLRRQFVETATPVRARKE